MDGNVGARQVSYQRGVDDALLDAPDQLVQPRDVRDRANHLAGGRNATDNDQIGRVLMESDLEMIALFQGSQRSRLGRNQGHAEIMIASIWRRRSRAAAART